MDLNEAAQVALVLGTASLPLWFYYTIHGWQRHGKLKRVILCAISVGLVVTGAFLVDFALRSGMRSGRSGGTLSPPYVEDSIRYMVEQTTNYEVRRTVHHSVAYMAIWGLVACFVGIGRKWRSSIPLLMLVVVLSGVVVSGFTRPGRVELTSTVTMSAASPVVFPGGEPPSAILTREFWDAWHSWQQDGAAEVPAPHRPGERNEVIFDFAEVLEGLSISERLIQLQLELPKQGRPGGIHRFLASLTDYILLEDLARRFAALSPEEQVEARRLFADSGPSLLEFPVAFIREREQGPWPPPE